MGMTPPRVVEAGPFWRWFLNRYDLAGIVMPITPKGVTIYFIPPWNKCPTFMAHEMVHVRQIHRDGRIKFSVLYLYYNIRFGYRNNRYEQEAYGQDVQQSENPHQQAGPDRQG